MTKLTWKGTNYFLGRYENEDDAAIAYNQAVRKIAGSFAYQNVIGENNKREDYDIKNKKQGRKRGDKNKTSTFVGVHKSSKQRKYRSAITNNKERIFLGYFDTSEQAAKAYDKKAYELHGDKAILNFPELIEEYKKP